VDRAGIALYALPKRDAIQPMVSAAAAAIRGGDGASAAGFALYKALFGQLAQRFQGKSHWLLALDGTLFDVPFAALPMPPQGRSLTARFLVERHITEIVPSVAYWLTRSSPRTTRRDGRLFLGVGDPIYNSADARLSRAMAAKLATPPLTLVAATQPALPRLVASSAELKACARAWNGNQVLLEGSRATRIAIQNELYRQPAVLHFATHFLPSADPEPQGTIVLSLAENGVADVLRPAEIARWHIGAQLVVLSGCHSAAGAVLPATGLLGLNRAWLAAGAQNVISSHWAVPDESGALFAALYRNLSAGGLPPAQALRAAQLEMLRCADWRARPQYWGAYFAMGKE
jgi:CHAT domain-containing protein